MAEYEAKGDSCLKTGMFNWNKDYAGAATHYDQAAKKFTDTQQYQKAIQVYNKLIDVNQHMKDPWATARNYEGILNCSRLLGVSDIKHYLQIFDKMALLYKLADATMSFINLVKDFALQWSEKGDREGAKQVYLLLFKHLPGSEDEIGRPEAVFGYVALLVAEKQYLEAVKFLLNESEIMAKIDPESTKRNIYAVDVILLSVLMDDTILAERYMNKFSEEVPNFSTGRDIVFCKKVIDAIQAKSTEQLEKAMNGTIAGFVFPASIISNLRKLKFKQPILQPAPVLDPYANMKTQTAPPTQAKQALIQGGEADLDQLITPGDQKSGFLSNPGAPTQTPQAPPQTTPLPPPPKPQAPVEDNPYL